MRGDGWFKHWLNPFQCKLLVLSAVELLLQDVIAIWVICMKNHSSRVKPVIAAIVSFMMAFSLALGPGLASARRAERLCADDVVRKRDARVGHR